MAESGSWPSIRSHGLLSTKALLDLFEKKGQERFEIESQWRPESVEINHPIYGYAVVRDQKPLRDVGLKRLLDGMSVREYYELLNGKTFFWVRRERLETLLNAKAYRDRSHTVLTVDTNDLVRKYQNIISLSPINSGAIIRGRSRRGVGIFKRIRDYPFDEMKKKKREEAIVELAVDYAIKDISELVIRVEEWMGSKPIQLIWEKKS
jgi:hypothetical protein